MKKPVHGDLFILEYTVEKCPCKKETRLQRFFSPACRECYGTGTRNYMKHVPLNYMEIRRES